MKISRILEIPELIEYKEHWESYKYKSLHFWLRQLHALHNARSDLVHQSGNQVSSAKQKSKGKQE